MLDLLRLSSQNEIEIEKKTLKEKRCVIIESLFHYIRYVTTFGYVFTILLYCNGAIDLEQAAGIVSQSHIYLTLML